MKINNRLPLHLKKMIAKNWPVVALLSAVFFLSSWSLLNNKFFRVHDYTHGARIAEMSRAWAEGQIPVRWTANFGYGFGMPLYEFYAPLPYYLGALLYSAGIDLVWSVKLLYLVANLGTLLGGYYLAKNLVHKVTGSDAQWLGILGAAGMTLAPYRAVNLFVRGALSETWGIMFFPWVLLFLVQLVRSPQKCFKPWSLFVLSLVGLFISHNLMTMIFVPFMFLFAFFFILINVTQKSAPDGKKYLLLSIKNLMTGFAMALGLTAFYLFPALWEKDQTQISQILGGYFHFSHHFIYIRQFLLPNWGYGGSEWGPNDGISFFLGWGQLLGAVLATLVIGSYLIHQLWLGKKSGANLLTRIKNLLAKNQSVALFLISSLSLALALYLSLLKAEFIWQSLPLISFVQFPWRFLGVSLVLIALLPVITYRVLPPKVKPWYTIVILIALAMNSQYFRPEKFLDDPDVFYYADPIRIRTQMSQILPDYIPTSLDTDQAQRLDTDAQISLNQTWQTITSDPDQKISLLVDRGHQKLFQTDFGQATKLGFRVAAYPGWQVELDGQPLAWATTDLGNIEASIPAGDHLVGLSLVDTPVRLYSDIISLLSLVMFLYLIQTYAPTHRH